jgi:hypothetical protein
MQRWLVVGINASFNQILHNCSRITDVTVHSLKWDRLGLAGTPCRCNRGIVVIHSNHHHPFWSQACMDDCRMKCAQQGAIATASVHNVAWALCSCQTSKDRYHLLLHGIEVPRVLEAAPNHIQSAIHMRLVTVGITSEYSL